MNNTEKKYNVYLMEEFYCRRMEELVEEERFDDSNSIFEEFVLDNDEPGDWLFLEYIEDVC